VVRPTCPCRVSRHELGQLRSLQSGAAFHGVGLAGRRRCLGPWPRPGVWGAVSRSWCGDFWLSPQPLSRKGSGCRGRSFQVEMTTSRFRYFASPSKTRDSSRGPSFPCGLTAPRVGLGLLSWGSKIASPPILMRCVHSRRGRGPSFGPGLPSPGLVPPLSFHPTPTVYSTMHPAGLLHPATGHEVRHVSGAHLPRPEGSGSSARGRWQG